MVPFGVRPRALLAVRVFFCVCVSSSPRVPAPRRDVVGCVHISRCLCACVFNEKILRVMHARTRAGDRHQH